MGNAKGRVATLSELKDYLKPYLRKFAKYNLDKAQSLLAKPESYNKINALRYYQRAEPLADFEPEGISKQIKDEYRKAIDALAPEIKNQIFCSQFYNDSCNIDELFNEIDPDEFNRLGANEKYTVRSNYFNKQENSVVVNEEVQKLFISLKKYRIDPMRKYIIDRAYFSDHEIINKQLRKVIQCQKEPNEEGAKKSLKTLILHNRFTIGRFLYGEFRAFHIAAKIQEDISALEESKKKLEASKDFETKRYNFAKGLFLARNQKPKAEEFFLANSGLEQYSNPTTKEGDYAIGLILDKPENQGFNDFIQGEAADLFMIENWDNAAFKQATVKVLQEITQPR